MVPMFVSTVACGPLQFGVPCASISIGILAPCLLILGVVSPTVVDQEFSILLYASDSELHVTIQGFVHATSRHDFRILGASRHDFAEFEQN